MALTKRPSAATTLPRPTGAASTKTGYLLASGQAVVSPETGLEYRVDRLLGEGGFGQAYLATRLGHSRLVPEVVCVKVSQRIDGWVKEAYFGQLLDVHLAFTGILSRSRRDAARAAKRAGAVVHSGPSARTGVVVRGRPNPLQAAGREGGVKLMEIKRLREKGHRITLVNETQFWRLVGRKKT